MAKPSKKVIDALTAIPGVGEATAKKLAGAGMKTKADVAKAGVKGLKAAGISAGTATKIAKAVASSAITKAKRRWKRRSLHRRKHPHLSPLSAIQKVVFAEIKSVKN